MLARSSPIPTRAGYAYEPKLDGFRCLVRTEGAFEARSRQFWNMTALVPELEAIPARGIFDGELIAFTDGQPDFVALTDRMRFRASEVEAWLEARRCGPKGSRSIVPRGRHPVDVA